MCASRYNTRRILNRLSDGQQIIGGMTALIYPAVHAVKNPPHFDFDDYAYNTFLNWLPVWASVAGVISFVKGLHLLVRDDKTINQGWKGRLAKAFAQMGSAGYLAYGTYEAKTAIAAAGAASTTTLPLLFLKFAINAAVEFINAYDDYKKTSDDCPLKGNRFRNVIIKGIALAGWSIFALASLFHNPAFLLMMGSMSLCIAGAVSLTKYIPALFSRAKNSDGNTERLPTPSLSSTPPSPTA